AWEMVRAVAGGVDGLLVVRDAAPYLLFAAVPLFAVDAMASGTPRRWITLLFLATTVIGTISYVIQWIGARNIGASNVTHLTLAGALPGALLAYAFAGALTGRRHRLIWGVGLA